MNESEIPERVHDVIESVGLDPDHVPRLNRDELSGGMAKRVALARALALDPLLIFYDEPTTGLDPEHAEQIQSLIVEVHGRRPEPSVERTTIIVTHDIGLLYRLRPRVVMLHEGLVHFDGTSEQFARSQSPPIQPYLELMPALHQRERNTTDDTDTRSA